MSRKRSSGIYLLADTGDCMKIILVDSFGWKTCLSGKPPAEALVDFVNFDFSAYRASVERLWNEHDVFADRPKVPYSDYEDFERQAVPLAQQIRETAPIAHWDVFHHIEQARTMKDDGRPIFASRKAHSVLTALRGPYFLQNRMKNIFEIAFADFERGTQQQRFRALEDVWPGLVDRAFPIRLLPEGEESDLKGQVKEYTLTDLFEFCLAELSLYFQQSRQRIARCENCWRYFVPKTEAQSRYCYGEVDGIPCKDAGPKHMRRFRADTDETLAVYERLRRRLEERANRLEIAGPGNHLRSFSRSQYEEWLDMAKAAKKSYQKGELSPEEFLRAIDRYGDLAAHEVRRQHLPEIDRTPWRSYIKRNMDFVPESMFMDMAYLDLGAASPAWEVISAQEQMLWAHGGHESLHNRYGAGEHVDPSVHANILDGTFSQQKLTSEEQQIADILRTMIKLSMGGELDDHDQAKLEESWKWAIQIQEADGQETTEQEVPKDEAPEQEKTDQTDS